jgi:hypothetical protein
MMEAEKIWREVYIYLAGKREGLLHFGADVFTLFLLPPPPPCCM